MPEGDTVRRTADRLHRALVGEVLERAELRWGRLDGAPLVGRPTVEVVSRGKHLLHRVEGGWTVHSHLKMEGQWRIEALGSPAARRGLGNPQARAVLDAGRWRALGLRLGSLHLVRTSDEPELVGHLGPDVLDEGLDVRAVVDGWRGSGRPLAEALLDQRIVAGIGTFWASEILWWARLHPWAAAADTDPDVLERALSRLGVLMRRAVVTGVQSSTGETRRGEESAVHARSGRPCRRCGDTVRVAMAGPPGRERTIFSCPTCQGGRAPTDDGRPQRPLGSGPSHR